MFNGQPGHAYAFRCRATDNANNTGDYPAQADAETTVDPTARPPSPWWDAAYSAKRDLIIQNEMPGVTLPVGYPVHLQFDSNSSPTAAELYNASQSNPKCNDLRIVYTNATELDRVVQTCSSSAIDIWFRSQVDIAGGGADSAAHQLYYGNATPDPPQDDPNQVWYPYKEGDTAYLYFFQEGNGATAYDSSGNNRNCSIDPSVTWVEGKFGRGLRFDRANFGDSLSLNCGAAAPLSSFSIEFWYKPDADDGGRIAGELAGGGNGGGGNNWLLQNFGGHIRLDVWDGAGGVQSNFDLRNAPYAGNWNHIAVTYNGDTEVKFYINGALDSTKTLAASGINLHTPPLEIGSSEGISQIKANLDGFRISSGVKTSFSYGAFAAIVSEPTTKFGDALTPPVGGVSPDLAVLSLDVYPNPGGGILAQAVIQNQGNLNTQNGFYTDIYLDHLPAGAGVYTGSIKFWVNDPITASARVTLTTLITDLTGLSKTPLRASGPISEITGTLYAQVDSSGVISETNNNNNIYDAGLEICLAADDLYEPNGSAAEATTLPLDAGQTHNINTLTDEDWFQIQASGGVGYVIQTANLSPSADTYLYLYDTGGATLLAANDDYGGALASQIEWTAVTTGTYYVVVKHWNPNVAGCGTSYDISFAEKVETFQNLYLPLILKNKDDTPTSGYLKWGTPGTGPGQFDEPDGIAVSSGGDAYVVDRLNNRVQWFSPSGVFLGSWGNYGSAAGQFNNPTGIAIDESDYVYVVDSGWHRIQKFTPSGAYVMSWEIAGNGNGEFSSPSGIASGNGFVYIVDTNNNRIQKFTTDETYVGQWGTGGSGDGEFNQPYAAAVDSQGYVYVADRWNHRIQKFTSEGVFVTARANSFFGPRGIVVSPQGNVYVTDSGHHQIQEFDTAGTHIRSWGSQGANDGEFNEPIGITVNQWGVYVVDSVNSRIQRFEQ